MPIEDAVRSRVVQLIQEGKTLAQADPSGRLISQEQAHQCSAWLVAAQNAVHQICEITNSPYRVKVDLIAGGSYGYAVYLGVGEMSAVLANLLVDADAGMLSSMADQARAETFDDFLDHAEVYFKEDRKNEAGVIAGVVFEDTVRRICRNYEIEEKDVKLDNLISALASQGVLSSVKAKRARAAAAIRTKASHAQWDEFELEDTRAAIEFTRELIVSRLSA